MHDLTINRLMVKGLLATFIFCIQSTAYTADTGLYMGVQENYGAFYRQNDHQQVSSEHAGLSALDPLRLWQFRIQFSPKWALLCSPSLSFLPYHTSKSYYETGMANLIVAYNLGQLKLWKDTNFFVQGGGWYAESRDTFPPKLGELKNYFLPGGGMSLGASAEWAIGQRGLLSVAWKYLLSLEEDEHNLDNTSLYSITLSYRIL